MTARRQQLAIRDRQKNPDATIRGVIAAHCCSGFGADRFGLRSFGSIDNRKTDALTFCQRFETLALDRAEVDEYVRTVLARDEAKALGVVKPFDRTLFAF